MEGWRDGGMEECRGVWSEGWKEREGGRKGGEKGEKGVRQRDDKL